MGMAKKTGEKKKKGGGGLPNQKTKTDAGTDVGKRALEVAEQAREKKRQKKEQKLKKEEEEKSSDSEEEEEEVGGRELPSVKSDKTLAGIAAKAQEAEKLKSSESAAFLAIASPAGDLKEEEQTVRKPQDLKNRAVIYISHVPHGFYEKAMRAFFGQFGTVTNLRLGRSKKTGRSCGFAFVEFKYREVAEVVAESMNNYLMFDRLLKCSVVPKERTSKAIFRGKVKEQKPPGKMAMMKHKRLVNAVKCDETVQRRQVRQAKRVKKSLSKLEKAGIQYNFQIAEMAAAK